MKQINDGFEFSFDITSLWKKVKKHSTSILLGLMFLTVVGFQSIIIWGEPLNKRIVEEQTGWQESFDLTSIPSGIVVWSHGVPGTEADFKHSKAESTRYYYFDLAILTNNMVIHVVRVPYYVVGVINPNGKIDFNNKPKKNKNLRNL